MSFDRRRKSGVKTREAETQDGIRTAGTMIRPDLMEGAQRANTVENPAGRQYWTERKIQTGHN